MPIPLAAWLHDIDKMALHLSWLPNGGLAWYGLSYLLGFVIAWLLMRKVMCSGITPMGAPFHKDAPADLVMTVALGVLLGGRLGYCVFYKPGLFIDFSKDMPFWGVLAINQGGMASHGGMIGALLAAWWWGYRNKLITSRLPASCAGDARAQSRLAGAWQWVRKNAGPMLYMLDLIAFAAPLGLCFGRLANFINGELYGRACDASYRFAVQFPQEIAGDWLREGNVKGREKYDALVRALPPQYMPAVDGKGNIDVHRFDELGLAAKNDPQLAEILHTHLTARHPSQLYGAAVEGLLVFLVLFVVWRKPRSPGLIAGLFGIVYAFARVMDEFFRMPDAQFIEGEKLPLVTQGQLLSFFVFAFGVLCVVLAMRSKGKKLGGWGKV